MNRAPPALRTNNCQQQRVVGSDDARGMGEPLTISQWASYRAVVLAPCQASSPRRRMRRHWKGPHADKTISTCIWMAGSNRDFDFTSISASNPPWQIDPGERLFKIMLLERFRVSFNSIREDKKVHGMRTQDNLTRDSKCSVKRAPQLTRKNSGKSFAAF